MPLFREALVYVERYHAERSISRGVKTVAGRARGPRSPSSSWDAASNRQHGTRPVLLAMSCTIFMAPTRTAAPEPARDESPA